MIKSKKQMYLVIGAFALVLMLGTVTYAFFNYTRTGSANTIRTGRIAFNSTQGQAINLTNVFPIDVTNGIPNNNANVGSVTINVTGDTTYTDGVEYLVSAVNVQNTIGSGAGAKQLPISIDVSVASNTNNDPATTLGTSDSDYFTNRGSSASTSIYKVLAGDTISTNDQLLVGYIKSGATGVDGNIIIKAYLDSSKILISDTYNNGETPTDNLGTPASLGEGKTVFTTTEWNSLQQNGVSFQVKVESNEGTWVDGPAPQLASCPGEGCVYSSTYDPIYTKWNTLNETPTVLSANDYSVNYQDILITGYNSFYGLVLDNNGEIERGYLCGLKDSTTLFCVEGVESKKEQNMQFLNSESLWNNTCGQDNNYNEEFLFRCGVGPDFNVWISDSSIGSYDGWRLYYYGLMEMS